MNVGLIPAPSEAPQHQVLAIDPAIADFLETEIAKAPRLGGRNQHAPGFEAFFQPVEASLDQCPANAPAAFFRRHGRQVEDVGARCPVRGLDAANGNYFPVFLSDKELTIEDRVIGAKLATNALGVIAFGVANGID